MTKRWLSLVLVLTLLSTLFTGVAFAATYDLEVANTQTHVLTPGVEEEIILGTIDCSEAGNNGALLAEKVAAHLNDLEEVAAFSKGGSEWDDKPVTATADRAVVTVKAKYAPAALPAGEYKIVLAGGGSSITFNTNETNTCEITVSNFGAYTIGDHYQIDVDSRIINVGKTAQAKLYYAGTPITEGVTWSSNDTSVATVDETGKITGLSLGDATITAETKSGATADIWIQVAEQVMTPKIEFTPQDDGATTVTITCPTEGAAIYYTMARGYEPNDPAEGEATTKEYTAPFDIEDAGEYCIKAIAYKEGMTKSDIGWGWVYVGEGAPDTKVDVTPIDATINGRGSAQFQAEVLPATADQNVYNWYLKLDDEDRYYNTYPYAYATVDDDGTVTSTGYMDVDNKDFVTLKVVAVALDGTEGEAELRIVKVDPTGVNYATNEITIPLGENKTFTASVAPAHASNDDLKLEITGSKVPGLTISDHPVVDPATGLHTWTLEMDKDEGKVGDYKLRVVAVENNVGKEITLHVVNPSAKAPTPVFTPSATTFT
ncbi:MAG TPA: Ig-like domain-containing protein, partial [Candidatus Excrementavichristensenella intestinipullorum]|nr:Ig-like domain-containing protein [Candidatus Excrementavichristensenella intestinipullorum]